ncbi:Uncharacterized protein dnm_053870 [Desulfonema magnum]|uniref:Uncharacterized protein n=1 Tax=Desulfonema magnum TaxID=45655 RepID=A0A975GPY9_9BACT|nr:Uncharacterized protein dnm_053870 [Desulfonema magnum]
MLRVSESCGDGIFYGNDLCTGQQKKPGFFRHEEIILSEKKAGFLPLFNFFSCTQGNEIPRIFESCFTARICRPYGIQERGGLSYAINMRSLRDFSFSTTLF